MDIDTTYTNAQLEIYSREQLDFILGKWVPALRSGQYRQVNGTLRVTVHDGPEERDYYCCLGVACDLIGDQWEPHSGGVPIDIAENRDEDRFFKLIGFEDDGSFDVEENIDIWGYDDANATLPDSVCAETGLESSGEIRIFSTEGFPAISERLTELLDDTLENYREGGIGTPATHTTLVSLNDEYRATFEQIADVIEWVVTNPDKARFITKK